MTTSIESTAPVGKNPILATTLKGTVYVTNARSGKVSAIDTVAATIATGGVTMGITSAAGRVYTIEGISSPSP